MAFRIGVKNQPVNKSGQNVKPAGAETSATSKGPSSPNFRKKGLAAKKAGPATKRPAPPATPQESAMLDKLMGM
jgi:hypothetical protein